MSWIKNWLFGKENNIDRDSAIWNMISSVEYSLQSFIIMIVITRFSGLYDAGVFMLAYTVAQMMATIGSYGMRSFQVSDIKEEYSFGTYYTSRIVSVVAMIIICMSYSVISGYNSQRLIIIAILCFYRVVDDVEDVFHGEMQKSMRLDVASKIVAVRIFISTMLFAIAYVLSNDLIVSSAVLTISAIIISWLLNSFVCNRFEKIKICINSSLVIKLLWTCLPLCFGGFIYNYLVSAPKYSIDRNLSEEKQAIFNILFMPVFAINLLSSFIFKPMIARMGVLWNEGDKKQFTKNIIKQVVIILGLTLMIILLGVTIGIRMLSFIYKVELKEYNLLFAMLILFGGFAALVAFMVVILTIIRKQGIILVAYACAMLVDLIFIDKMVIKFRLWGAGMVYGIAMLIVLLILSGTYVSSVRKEKINGKFTKNDIS